MKTLSFAFLIISFSSFFLLNISKENSHHNKINTIIGDISFVSKFGNDPGLNDNENLRIKTHLEYVKNLLRTSDVSDLTFRTQQKRKQLLNYLHEYIIAGKFPVNYDHEYRQPCFIDKEGRICAVGYLIEKSSGRQIAEYINNKYKYNYITEMNDEIVVNWIETSGLTETECAMIQPNYEFQNPENFKISKSNAILSATSLAANLTLNVLNGIEIANQKDGSLIPYIGMVTGISQIVIGAVNFPERDRNSYDNHDNNDNSGTKVLSLVNIGVGASTFILSLWNAIDKDKDKANGNKTSWNIYSYPEKEKKFNIGVSLIHKF